MADDVLIVTSESLIVGEFVLTKLDGYFRITSIGDLDDHYYARPIEEGAESLDHQLTYLESYGISMDR